MEGIDSILWSSNHSIIILNDTVYSELMYILQVIPFVFYIYKLLLFFEDNIYYMELIPDPQTMEVLTYPRKYQSLGYVIASNWHWNIIYHIPQGWGLTYIKWDLILDKYTDFCNLNFRLLEKSYYIHTCVFKNKGYKFDDMIFEESVYYEPGMALESYRVVEEENPWLPRVKETDESIYSKLLLKPAYIGSTMDFIFEVKDDIIYIKYIHHDNLDLSNFEDIIYEEGKLRLVYS